MGFEAFAASKKLALVRKIQGTEQLPPNLARQLQTTSLQVVSRQPDYEVLLSGADAPEDSVVSLFAIESEVGRSNNGYRIEARLIDVRTKKVMTKALREDVRLEDLSRLFRGALESLFIPDEKKSSNNQNPQDPVEKSENLSLLQKQKKLQNKNNQANSKEIDFKKRIQDLQMEADVAIVEKTQEKANGTSTAVQNKPQENSPAKEGTAIISTAKNPAEDKPISRKNYPLRYEVGGGYDSRQVESTYLVGTLTKIQLLTVRGSGDYPISYFSGKMAVSGDLAFSRAFASPVALPTIYQIGLYGTFLQPRWKISLGFQRDASFFVNLPEPGAGLQSQSLVTTWIKIKSAFILKFNAPWRFDVSYGTAGMVETNYKPLSNAKNWQGTNVGIAVTPPYSYKNWKSNIAFERINMTSEGDRSFTLNDSRIALSVRRSL